MAAGRSTFGRRRHRSAGRPAAKLPTQRSGAAHPMTRVAAAMQNANDQHYFIFKSIKHSKWEAAKQCAASRSINHFATERSLAESHEDSESFVEKIQSQSALLL